jgi:hypothetical protein
MEDVTFTNKELEYLKDAVESSIWFGDNPKFGEKLLNKINKALSITAVGCQREQFCDKCDKGVIWNDDGISGESCSCVK